MCLHDQSNGVSNFGRSEIWPITNSQTGLEFEYQAMTCFC